MTKLKNVNENYIHVCELTKINIKNKAIALSKMNFTQPQMLEIIDFFLFNAPVLKTNTKTNEFGLKSLKDYGWVGPSLGKLEGKLLNAANLSIFCFIKSDTIQETLKAMDLEDKICVEHPRAVLKQNVKVTLLEDGSTRISQQETRMECLFRHLRNSLAHNLTYQFDNGNILLEDQDDNNRITARILIPKDALLEWIKIIKQDNKH